MNVTGTDLILAAEITLVAVTAFFAFAYALREIQRLREQLRSLESELREHRIEIYTGDDR